jgi:hypothetical protein
MQPIRRVLFVCLGLSISFIGLLVWNIPLGGNEDSINDWYGWIYFGWGLFGCFGLGPLVILYGLFKGLTSPPKS